MRFLARSKKSFSSFRQVTMVGLLKLLAFACCVITATAECTSSKYNQGTKDKVNCFNSSIAEVQKKLHGNVVVVSVLQSVIPAIPDLAFIQNATTVEDLKFHDCGINQIGSLAFNGLLSLKRLSLAYNNITKLNVSWFLQTPLLEQLDLSFNKIVTFESSIYVSLQNVQRLDLNDNLLTCIPKKDMDQMRKLKDIRIQENPLAYVCRAELTLWLKDHQVNYATNDDNFIWLDSLLWQCLLEVPYKLGTTPEAERKMNICAISNMFNQLVSVLGASPSMDTSKKECTAQRQLLTQCLRNHNVTTNGHMIMNYLALADNVPKIGVH